MFIKTEVKHSIKNLAKKKIKAFYIYFAGKKAIMTDSVVINEAQFTQKPLFCWSLQ